MGHTDPSVTLRVYGHLFEGVQEELTIGSTNVVKRRGRRLQPLALLSSLRSSTSIGPGPADGDDVQLEVQRPCSKLKSLTSSGTGSRRSTKLPRSLWLDASSFWLR